MIFRRGIGGAAGVAPDGHADEDQRRARRHRRDEAHVLGV
jgi:hypothetical protein